MGKGGWTTDTKVLSIRIPATVYSILQVNADKKGITVAAFVKHKIEEYARLAVPPVQEEYKVIGGVKYRV